MLTKLVTVSAFAATLITATLANADVSDSKGPPQMTVPTERSARPADAPKSEDTALDLSLGGTAASVAIAAIGIGTDNAPLALLGVGSSLLTPSLGEWYAGKGLTAGMGIRAASALAVVVGFGQALSCIDTDDSCRTPGSAGVLMVGGLLGYAGGAIYDIATAKRTVREYNAAHGFSVTIAPTAMRTSSGQSTMGVGLSGTF